MRELNSVPPLKRTHVKSWTVARLLRARPRPAEEGGALVEMAFVLPFLATLVLGIMSVGTTFMNYLDLTEATGSGAQYLQLIRTSTSDPCADTLTAITKAAPNLSTASGYLQLAFNFNGTKLAAGTTSCPGDQQYLSSGTPVTVTATYPANLQIYGVNFLPSGWNLSATVTEYEY
jgi:Flp pilus assembly protein TadG